VKSNPLLNPREPEVLMDGAHTIQVAAQVTQRVWASQIKAMADHHILLEGCLIKPNMVRHGEKCPTPATTEEIAHHTVKVLANTIPPSIPGVNFLSGGMSEENATLALNAINRVQLPKPWTLSFSYGRALQVTVLKVWQGKDENMVKAQEALMIRAKANSEACLGKYGGGAGGDAAKQSQFVANYTY
jgi:fructose-bisphosphate aldolase class I